MTDLFTTQALISLLTLTALEIILGIVNVIFVSIIIGKLPGKYAQKIAPILDDFRNNHSFWLVYWLWVGYLRKKVRPFSLSLCLVSNKGFDIASLVMIAGGLFLIVKTVMEIHHKLEGDDEESAGNGKKVTFTKAIIQIMLVDAVFSFDSVITASGIGHNLAVMITAVIIAMVVMFLFSNKISAFIHKHPTLTMLALSFLVMIGLVLVIEGWRGATIPTPTEELHLKNYVYFAMAFSFGVELLNMRIRKKSKPIELREAHTTKKLQDNKEDLPK